MIDSQFFGVDSQRGLELTRQLSVELQKIVDRAARTGNEQIYVLALMCGFGAFYANKLIGTDNVNTLISVMAQMLPQRESEPEFASIKLERRVPLDG